MLFRPNSRSVYNVCRRWLGTVDKPIEYNKLPEHRSLVVERFGEPVESLILKTRKPEEVLPKSLDSNEILVENLAACINPADINLIQGVYGIKPKLPAIVGNEGISRVLDVGSKVNHLKAGDMAVGIMVNDYWQSYSVQDSNTFFKLKKELDATTAAQLKVNPCTAYRMIKDFNKLKPGDVIIQNGANSAVGVYVIQLAKLWGLKTINVIRDRPEKDAITQELKDFGADIILTENEISKIEVTKPILQSIGKPKLLLNCVGGKNVMDCQKTLDIGGTVVTFGQMSKQAFSVSVSAHIFKAQDYRHFWVSSWYKERQANRREEIGAMLDDIVTLFGNGSLKPKRSTLINFEDRQVAFSGSNNTKYIFSINKS